MRAVLSRLQILQALNSLYLNVGVECEKITECEKRGKQEVELLVG